MKLSRVLDVKGEPLYCSEYLYNNLMDAVKNAKKYNGDLLIVIDGEEGSGKSTLGRQVAKILDPSFTEERIAFSSVDFRKLAYNTDKFKAIVLDESKEDLDRKSTMSKRNREFMNFLSQARVLHKLMIVILPSVYDLDSYVAEHRAKMLLHTYKYRGRRPGYYSFYGKNAIKKLFLFGKKYRVYNTKSSFFGRFTKQETVDLSRYDAMKQRAVAKYNPLDNQWNELREEVKREVKQDLIKERVVECEKLKKAGDLKLTQDVLAKVLGIHPRTYRSYKAKSKS